MDPRLHPNVFVMIVLLVDAAYLFQYRIGSIGQAISDREYRTRNIVHGLLDAGTPQVENMLSSSD